MKKFYLTILFSSFASLGFPQNPIADFTLVADGCLEERINIENTSVNAANYEWDFCSGDLESNELNITAYTPSNLSTPVGISFVKFNNDWYGFLTNIGNSTITRIEFGNSLNNIPAFTNLGNLGGLLSAPQDIKAVAENGLLYLFVSNRTNNKFIRINLGTNINNASPTTDILLSGNADILNNGIDVVYDEQEWIAIYSSSNFLRLVRLGDSPGNIPTAADHMTTSAITGISNIGDISFILNQNAWYAIIVGYTSKSIFRLSFGSTIFSNPIATNITPPGISNEVLHGINIEKEAGKIYAFVSTFSGNFFRLDFSDSILNSPLLNNLEKYGVFARMLKTDLVYENSKYFGLSTDYQTKKIFLIEFPNNCQASVFYSIEKAPFTSYFSPGTYSISLTAMDENGNSNSKTKQITVLNQQAPQVVTETNSNLCLDNPKTFTSQNLTPDQTISSHTWDFGDGTTATGPEASHQYTTPGLYKVRLSVESENGCGNFIEKEVNIYAAPVPDFTFPTTSICTNGEISFENTTPGVYKAGDITWSWDFGDGTTSAEKSPKHTYTTGGTKTVMMTASIPGCSESKSYDLTVIEGPTVNFVEDRLCFGQTVQFTNLSGGADITDYTWDFGNGENSTVENPTVAYSAPGIYEVSLTVQNGVGCSNTFKKSVKVNALPVVSFTVASACSGAPVQFQDKSTIANGSVGSWLWKFGDGTENTSRNPSHTFTAAGSYDVKLIVTTVAGCVDSVTQSVNVNIAPVADFEVELGCPGTLTRFTDTSQDPGGDGIAVNYWIINGIYQYTQNPAVLFTKAGTYTVTLDITSGTSCRSTITKNIVIDPLPTANFSFENTCIGSPTQFSDQSQMIGADDIESWSWRFGEFGTSTEQNPSFEFPQTGSFPVTLTVTTKRGCSTIINKTVSINGLPQAIFSPLNNFGAPPLSVGFSNNSIGASSYQWWFGDAENTMSTEAKPTFVYNEVGDYEVKMVASSPGGCADTAYATISVLISELDVSIENISVFTNTGDMQMVLLLRNNGTVPVTNMNINIDLGGVLSLNERFSETIDAGETLNYPVGFDILEEDLSGVAYICARLSVINDNLNEVNLADNERCLDIQGLFLLTDPYPNPINHTFNLEFFMPEKAAVGLVLTDMRGKIVMNIDLPDTKAGQNKYTYDFNHLAAGMYVVKIAHKNETFVRKVMVQ